MALSDGSLLATNAPPVDCPVIVGRQEGIWAAAGVAFIKSRGLYDVVV